MARKKKNTLPSGSYRVRVWYEDSDGKRHQKNFTAPTKAEAEVLAWQWKTNHDARKNALPSLAEAVDRYITSKDGVLSASTIAGYKRIFKNHIDGKWIGAISLSDLNSEDLQTWITQLRFDHSPKSVKNIYGLVASTLKMFTPDKAYNVTLPQPEKPVLYCPSSEDIKCILQDLQDRKDTDMLIAVMLSAFCTLRRSEICALDSSDVKGNVIHVHQALVMNEDRSLVIKTTKTVESDRHITIPDTLVKLLKGRKGKIVSITPDCLSERFTACLVRCGLPHFRFHDLRHYSASILHAIGVPDQYIMDRGGWTTDGVMKRVYRNTITEEKKRQTDAINSYFDNLL